LHSLRKRAPWRYAAITLVFVCSCGGEPQPNVLVVTFDTARYDRFGVTGDPEARTPIVDALAAGGVLFERAYSSVPITLPAHTTILSGLEPREHGVHNNGRFRVPDKVETFAEILKRSSYETAAMVSAFVLDGRFNLGQGFDVYGDDVDKKSDPFSTMVPQREAAATTDEALAWIAERSGAAPFFLWVHYYDPHQPRTLELPFQGISDAYRAEIAYTDEQFGRLLAGAAEADHGRGTLIAFTADHGEGLGDHGEETHAILAYDSTLHVPLILAGPGVPTGVRTRVMARHVDLVPTLLAALALPIPADLPGRNLLELVSKQVDVGGEPEVVSSFECRESEFSLGWLPIEGVRTQRWKYTALPEPAELYDVIADPGETRNLVAEQPETAARMESLHAALAPASAEVDRMELDPEDAAKLAALGYVEAPASFAEAERPDPRRFVVSHNWISSAESMASSGRYEQAVELLETLAEGPSMRPLALRKLAPILERLGRTDDAVAAYRHYLELTGSTEARFSLARALVELGRAEEGLRELDAEDLDSPGVARLRARALAELGRHLEARAALDEEFAANEHERLRQRARLAVEARVAPDAQIELRSLLAQAPDSRVLRSSLSLRLAVAGDTGDSDEVLALLQALVEEKPDSPEVLANMGWSFYRIGHPVEAAAALEAALEAAPSRLLDRVRLGVVLGELGDTQRAVEELSSALRLQPGATWAEEARAHLKRFAVRPEMAAGEGAGR